MRNNQRGFSLIELMIVVAIMGTLSMMAGPDLVKSMKIRITRNHAKSIARTLMAARVTTDRGILSEATATICSACFFGDLNGPPSALYNHYWRNVGFDTPPKDAWGNYYLLEENDGEYGPDCRMDALYSKGPDGVWAGQGDGDDLGGDDIVVRLPTVTALCGENPITGGYHM